MNIETSTTEGLTGTFGGVVRLPTILRVVLPGALAVLLASPLLVGRSDLGSLLNHAPDDTLELLGLALTLSFVAGLPVSALNDFFYKLYEGRVLWPNWLLKLSSRLQNRRVSRLLRRAGEAHAADEQVRYDELWFELRAYPENDEGEPHATHPTLLGNILAAYEAYPRERYGMDSVFYWPRLWLELDAEKKQEIDNAWSVTDGLLNLSAVCAVGAGVWGLVGAAVAFGEQLFGAYPAIARAIEPSLPFGDQSATWWGVLALASAAWGLYRVSLPLHRRNGEIFKAVFDLYRDKLDPMARIGPREKERWDKVWTYLQYGGLICSRCDTAYSSADPRCPDCSRKTDKNLEDLASLGKDKEDTGRAVEDPRNRGVRPLAICLRRLRRRLIRRRP